MPYSEDNASPAVRSIFDRAKREAQGTSSYLGSEHLLVGLLVEESDAKTVLEKLGVSAPSVRERIPKEGGGHLPSPPPETLHVQIVLDQAAHAAAAAESPTLLPEHLLYGLLLDMGGTARHELLEAGVTLERARNALGDLRGKPSPPRIDARPSPVPSHFTTAKRDQLSGIEARARMFFLFFIASIGVFLLLHEEVLIPASLFWLATALALYRSHAVVREFGQDWNEGEVDRITRRWVALCRVYGIPPPEISFASFSPLAVARQRGRHVLLACPRDVDGFSDLELELLLLHEIGHIHRKDPSRFHRSVIISTILTVLCCAIIGEAAWHLFNESLLAVYGNDFAWLGALIYWLNIASSLVLLRLRYPAEYHADRFATECSGDPSAYAHALSHHVERFEAPNSRYLGRGLTTVLVELCRPTIPSHPSLEKRLRAIAEVRIAPSTEGSDLFDEPGTAVTRADG